MRFLRRSLAAALAVVLAAGFLVATPATEAEAATAADFNPGNIISDQNFFDGDAMSASEVQSFLNAQVRQCETGYTCLKDYRQNAPSMPSNAYCAAMPARDNDTAASIITRVAQACDVSPRVLLVLLQKEQSLVSLTRPTQIRYDRATGFACPDTAPCDSSFGSFFYQVYYAARQFQRYAKHPESYNHRAGQQNRVLFHPNAACGSSTVYIANQATAGLYNYTPYQPNAAALTNLYGTGDSCSAYGNRNFWRMWTDWFGNPAGEVNRLIVREQGSSTTYLVNGTWIHPFPNGTILNEYQRSLGATQVVSNGALASYTKGQAVTRWLRDGSGGNYFVDDGKAFRFADCKQVGQWGRTCSYGIGASAEIHAALRDGGQLRNIVGWKGEWWYMADGRRHPIGDTANIGARGMSYANSWMSPGALDEFGMGIPFLAEGYGAQNYSGTQAVMRTGSGLVWIDPAQMELDAFADFGKVTWLSMNAARASSIDLPNRIAVGTQGYVVTNRGLLEVRMAEFGGTSFFSPLTQANVRGIPSAGRAFGQHYQAELGSSTVWLMRDGMREPVTATDRSAAAATVPSTIHRGVEGYLDWIPERSSYSPGTLLRDTESGELLLTSRSTTVRVSDARVLNQLGLDSTPTAITPSVRAGLPAVSMTLDADYGIRCGVDGIASWGQLRPYANATARQAWRLTHEQLPADICAQIPRGSTIDRIAIDNDGSLYLIENGTRRAIDSQRTLRYHGFGTIGQSRISGYALHARPAGTPLRPYYYSGTVVRSQSSGQLYIVDDHRLLRTNATVVAELQSPMSVTVSDAVIATFPSAGSITTTLVERDGVRYALIDGRLVRFPWQDAQQFGTQHFTSISATLFSKIPVSGWMSRWIEDPQGRVWYVTNGTRNLVDTAAERAAAAGQHIHRVDATVLQLLPVR
ncbi:hypothetical protein [Agrococcus carbonis]|uniref:Tachylectin n=1 Tax=Agrococcus carbonis TaxID=684552 RepID=A0A1H1M4E6_9MICO|nr:hypothetical protein [Agrococcus carbonis]SDR81557.1 hypothetical protein SAMN04489719_0858 [Agrococcus carbonis]